MVESAITSCFVHSVAGVFSVLFFWLATTSGLTALIVMRKFKEDDPIYQAVAIRLKFGVAYLSIGVILLLVAIVLGTVKSGIFNVKFLTSFVVLLYNSSIPFIAGLKNRNRSRLLAHLLLFSGPLSFLNLLVGNFVFTSFHNFL